MDDRAAVLRDWAADQLNDDDLELKPASADASFRRYFRIQHNGDTYILMDAPPPQEDVRPFVAVARGLLQAGVNVPVVIAEDIERGFLLLGDLGRKTYLEALNADTVERLYGDALGALTSIQVCGPGEQDLPPYDETLLKNEMALFPEWLLGRYLDLNLAGMTGDLDQVFTLLVDSALSQPRVCVHRDFHSRNLMVTEKHNPGVLDFQDAVFGPITYDLVSLLRDCYISWPRHQVEDWVLGFRELAIQSGTLLPDQADDETFMRWFDWMGVQRHLKAAGIFARLFVRDGKSGYLQDIPRTLGYVTDVAEKYDPLKPLSEIIKDQVMPPLLRQLKS